MIDKIETLSLKISEDIHAKLGYSDSLEIRHLRPFQHWGNFDFKDSVLILGLNPSSSDIEKQGVANDCFIHYFPDYWTSTDKKWIIKEFAQKGYSYNNYFKKPYELFLPFNYRPIWTNRNYLDLKKDKLTSEEYNLLNGIQDTGKYCVFSDLLHYKETTAKNIEKIINKSTDLENKILDLFALQIKFFKSKIVFINNAFASRLLTRFITHRLGLESKVYTNLEFQGAIIVFSAILTGARAMDNYSHERLKYELKDLIKSK
ncbi:MAG TPA: hypothetical protein P5509_05365 [Bacteroidales bacterium]|nr:hypothetical protein [Bacteroidales bacterium]